MNWTFKLIPPVHILSLHSHYFYYSLYAHLIMKDKEETLFDCTHNNITSSDEYITWIPEWHAGAQKEHTFFTYTTVYICSSYIIALQQWCWRWTQKERREDVEKSKREGKKRYMMVMMVVISSHNQTIPIERLKYIHIRRITSAVRRTSWKRKRYGFSLLFVLMQKYDDSCW